MKNNCIFCRIANGEIPAEKIWENEDFMAILDIHPVGEGHSLVIPKKHFDDLTKLNKDFSSKYIGALQEVVKILTAKYKCRGFNVVLNNGEVAGQVVKHVHFHILPRKKGDNKSGLFIG